MVFISEEEINKNLPPIKVGAQAPAEKNLNLLMHEF